MSPEQHRALLGDDVLAHIDAVVDAAPEPTPELVDRLRRIFSNPQGSRLAQPSPAADAA